MDASGSGPGHQGVARQVRGRSLHDVLHDPGTGIAQQAVIPLDPSRVVLIARAILTALAGGAVHGYINPHTILLTDDGNALLVGDRVAPGATPANDIFALGMALFEAVEGYAPHPAEALPPMKNAGGLGPLIEALTQPDPTQRPDAATALGLLRTVVVARPGGGGGAGGAASGASAADVTETRDLPQVEGDAAAPGGQAGVGGAGDWAGGGSGAIGGASGTAGGGSGTVGGAGDWAGGGSGAVGGASSTDGSSAGAVDSSGTAGGSSDDTSLLPPVPADPGTLGGAPAGMPGSPLGPTGSAGPAGSFGSGSPPQSFAYPAYEAADHPHTRRKVLVIGGVATAVVLIGGVTLGVTRPWHQTDNSVSTVPGVPVASTSVPATPSTSAPATPSAATSTLTPTPTPTPTPTAPKPTTLVSMTLCLDAASGAGGVHSGARVTATNCHGSPNQAWQLQPDGTIHSMADGNLCLDAAVRGDKVPNAAQISAWTCHGGPNQDWVWNADGTVSPAANKGLCLDAAGPVPIHAGANVTAWPCNGGPNEKWAKQ